MLTDFCAVLYISQQYLSTGAAVARCLVMLKLYAETAAQRIKTMANSRKYASARLNGADIADIGLPFYPVPGQAFFKNAKIEHRIMSH